MIAKLEVVLISLLLTACGGNDAYYKTENFQGNTGHWQEYPLRANEVCRVARQVLLKDGYVIESAAATATSVPLIAVKEFKGDENQYSILRVYVTCEEQVPGSRLFITAVESGYDIKASRQSSGVGIPLVGPLTISKTSESEAQVKTSGQTITEKSFYERFFRALIKELGIEK